MYSLFGIPYWLFPISIFVYFLLAMAQKASIEQVRTLADNMDKEVANLPKIADFMLKSTYSNRKFDIIDPNKWII